MSDKRLVSKSFFRSSSQSLIERELESAIERASSSVAESDVNERELQRNIRQTSERQESFETLIETYVDRMLLKCR
jgi:prefoldin subunit 5